ncbi:MAG: 3-deoxy-8-phosphooctulonate synthase [Bacteroidales bacterium]|nr:3-deoxy-8-phosphooctulonate synthase [Bacteroidales bacterium]
MIKEYLPNLKDYGNGQFFLIAGPCVIEDETSPFKIAETLAETCFRHKIPFIFKGSYRKANRSKSSSFTGIGDEKALRVLAEIGKQFGIPVITDIHTEDEAEMAAAYADLLQIPAFLCRQTELLVAAARTGKVINIKKGQFASAETMQFAVEKVKSGGNNKVILTERGNSFGYQDLIVDYRNINEMQKNLVPVVLDVTHSLQIPNQAAGVTGGRPDLIPLIARAGIAAGADGLFIETHPNPEIAKSDGANMLRLELMDSLLMQLTRIREAIL